jgi:hypothetical protein
MMQTDAPFLTQEPISTPKETHAAEGEIKHAPMGASARSQNCASPAAPNCTGGRKISISAKVRRAVFAQHHCALK